MKFCFLSLFIFTFIVLKCLATPDSNIYMNDRVIFYYEILHRVEQPLIFEKWIREGQSLFLDKAYYAEWTEPMERFYQASLKGTLLPKDAFFGLLIKSHQLEALGLYDFLTKPRAWEYFLQNACWARQHAHPHLFVYAFTRAILERGDQHELMPFIYEILPRHFFDWRFVQAATEFMPANWTDVKPDAKASNSNSWQPWQWWKILGLSEHHWYAERSDIIAKNVGEGLLFNFPRPSSAWWRPNDYTRNLPNHLEQHSVLSYLTEDADWNAFWHLVSVNYSPIIGGFSSDWKKDVYAEYWSFILEKFLARYYLERLSHGLGDIPDFQWNQAYKDGYDPELVAINNQRFVAREIDWLPINHQSHKEFRDTLKYIEAIVDAGSHTLRNGTQINLREATAFAHIMELLRGHTDPNGNFIESHWYTLAHMHFANQQDVEAAPHVLLNFETMARDPFFYVFHKELVKLRQRFYSYLTPYTAKELHTPGLKIIDLNVSKLITFDDIFDFDVTNLMRSNLTFAAGRFSWHENLLARRVRLNHRPFDINVTIAADKHFHNGILLRFYLGPKFDEYGRAISLEKNRHNFIELGNIKKWLNPGINTLQLSYHDIFIRKQQKNNYFQSKIYHCAVSRNCFGFMPLFVEESKNCGLHDRLLLPHGWSNGLPMQLFVMAVENDEIAAQLWWRPCVFRLGKHSLGYPFDRTIPNEQEFIGSNMLFKDVKIFHEHSFDRIPNKLHNSGEFFYALFEEIEIEIDTE